MKKWLATILAVLMTLGLGACGQSSEVYEVSTVTVEATCLTEGYTEHVYSDGYIARDTFTEKISHSYVDVSLATEEHIHREICQNCGKEKVTFAEEVVSTDVVIDPNRPRVPFTSADVMACAMILEETADDAIRAMRVAEKNGARGIMIYVTTLTDEYKTFEHLQRIFHCVEIPVLAIAYGGPSYDWMANMLKLCVQAGASAVDLQGNMWSPVDVRTEQAQYKSDWEQQGFGMSFVSASPAEVCLNPEARARQIQFINEIHAMGGEVLLSMHCYVSLTEQQAVDLGVYIEAMGVDIVKMVLSGNSMEFTLECLKSTLALSKTLECKFSLHSGTTLSRLMCPMFGSYIAFCVDYHQQQQTSIQPSLETMLAILNSPEFMESLK